MLETGEAIVSSTTKFACSFPTQSAAEYIGIAKLRTAAKWASCEEKYVLDLTNYAKVPVTIKVNGQWVGQWDNHANVPLDMVVKGENQLTVDLASQPQNTLTVNINTTRDGQGVTILSLNYQGQSGTHTSTFVAR